MLDGKLQSKGQDLLPLDSLNYQEINTFVIFYLKYLQNIFIIFHQIGPVCIHYDCM